MLYDVLAILFGSLLGFLVTWRFVEIGVKKEEEKVLSLLEFLNL